MSRKNTNTLFIKTPEGVIFSLLLAGPVMRFFAWLIDFCVVLVLLRAATIWVNLLGFISYDFMSAINIAIYFIIGIGYTIAMEWFWRGQTIGKRLFRLRVMDELGLHLRFSQIVIRNLLRIFDSMPILFYLVGGLACLISKQGQRLGDMAANTIVIYMPKISEPDLDQVLEDKYNSFQKYPHLKARLHQLVSPAQANIALNALIRRHDFNPIDRLSLFNDIASYFKAIVTFPDEATEGISDEQYIRNIVDILFRP